MFTGVWGEKIVQKSPNPWVHLASWLIIIDKKSGAQALWRAACMEVTDLPVPCSVLYTLDQTLPVSVMPLPWYFLLMLRTRPNSAVDTTCIPLSYWKTRYFSPSQCIRFVPGRCSSKSEKILVVIQRSRPVITHTSLSMFYSRWFESIFSQKGTLCFISARLPLCWIQFSTLYRKGMWGWNLSLIIICSDLSVHIVTLFIYTFFLFEGWGSLLKLSFPWRQD